MYPNPKKNRCLQTKNSSIGNIIDNAIKYCEKQPKVEIRVDETKSDVKVEISDNGIGLKSSDIKYVFDKFYRVPTGNLHNVKGFGLGLYYVNVIMELHNGYISVEKNTEGGSTFILKIPKSDD